MTGLNMRFHTGECSSGSDGLDFLQSRELTSGIVLGERFIVVMYGAGERFLGGYRGRVLTACEGLVIGSTGWGVGCCQS